MWNTEKTARWRIACAILVGVMLLGSGAIRPSLARGNRGLEALLALADTTGLVPVPPAPPAPPDTSSKWKFDWETDDDRDVVRMGEDIEVAAGERIEGDVVAVGGKITVFGHVVGDVVSIGGGLDLKKGSVIEGDAVSVGGVIDREEGSIVRGQDVSVGMVPKGFLKAIRGYSRTSLHEASAVKIWWDFLRYLGFFLVGMVLYLAFPDRMSAIRGAVRSRFWLSLVTGFGSMLGAIVLLALLVITCIGILVAVPGIFVSILAVVGGGAAAIALLGQLILRQSGDDRRAWLLALVGGLGALFIVQLLGRLLALAGGPGETIGDGLVGIVKLAWVILLLVGLGSLVLSRFGKPEPTYPRPAWERYQVPRPPSESAPPAAGAPTPPVQGA